MCGVRVAVVVGVHSCFWVRVMGFREGVRVGVRDKGRVRVRVKVRVA